ncbi:MAG: globin [Pseudomonadales bacterium]|nr:globin [Pseudomonadales bacterium]
MYQEHLQAIKDSIDCAITNQSLEQVGADFFQRFFDTYPETKRYFNGSDISVFAPKKFKIIAGFLIDTIAHPNYAESQIATEIIRHTHYGLSDHIYYFTLIDCFQATVLNAMGHELEPEITPIWNEVSTAMKANIQQAAQDYL